MTEPAHWWPIAEWTPEQWTAGGTVLLAIVTAILAIYTYQLWKEARETSKRQAKDMEKSLAAAEKAANAATLNAEIMRQMYVAGNLPKLALSELAFEKEGMVQIKFELRNDGLTKAEIVRVSAFLILLDTNHTLGAAPRYNGKEVSFDPPTLRPGESTYPITVFTTWDGVHITYSDDIFVDRNNTLWMIGFSDYRDEIGNYHKVGFARRYAHRTWQFIPHESPEYEYQR